MLDIEVQYDLDAAVWEGEYVTGSQSLTSQPLVMMKRPSAWM